jgi:hypothetical protein
MASDFLKNLQKTVETGDFNSEAAKKIIEITELADSKMGSTKAIDAAMEVAERQVAVQTVTEQEAAAINSSYEEKMANIKKQDAINVQIATLIDIEDMLKANIDDMFSFTDELEAKFANEFESEDPMFGELYQKIENLKLQYKKLII